MREVGAQMVPIKLHLLADERRPRGVPASRLEGVVVRKGKGKGKGAHGESLLFDPGEAHDCLRQFEHVLVAPPPGELQRAMVLDVEASTAPGTFAKVVVVYPAKEKKSIKALHAVRDASRMLAEVNIPKRSDWDYGGGWVHAHAGRSAQAKLCGKARLSACKEAQGAHAVCSCTRG